VTAYYKRLVNASVRFTMVAERGLNKLFRLRNSVSSQTEIAVDRTPRWAG
jgi:hypothetical protein